MRWHDIERSGSHFIDVSALTKTARDRLAELGQDDEDELFSIRLTGRERVFGIRDRWIFKILWWDPDHQVCPSYKKHT